MKQQKLIIILVLLVLLPVTLLGWQGWKMNQDTQKLNDARFSSLVTARLNQVDTIVQSYFEEMQLKWSLLIPQWELNSEATRERIESDGNIRQIFVLDPQRIRSFPPTDTEITADEKVFVDRLASVWQDPDILFSNQINSPSVEQIAKLDIDTEESNFGVEAKFQSKSKIGSEPSIASVQADSDIAASNSNPFTSNISQSSSLIMSDTAEIIAETSESLSIVEETLSEINMQANTREKHSKATSTASEINIDVQQSASVEIQSESVSKPAILSSISKKLGSISSSTSELASKSQKIQTQNNPNKQGWYMWHWGNDANLIFWQEGQDNSIVGVEMEPVRVKSDLISRLPNTVPEENSDFRLRLVDTAGHVVYQWGNYEINPANQKNQQQREAKAQQRRALSYPLSSWSLEYYGEAFTEKGASRYSLLLSLLAFALFLTALAWFLYREQTREMRLAEKRVQFVSQVSHELKTPLTNIRMYAEMLEGQVEDDEQPKRYVQVITDESKRLTRLISNVLNFSRAPRIHKREIHADDIIRQSIEQFAPSFEAKGISLHTDLKADKAIHSDSDILEQILNNLLSNVEKYGASGKRLDIHSEIQNSQFIVKVRDYGLGISKAERKNIFKPFYRIDDTITEGVSGTGIGLTIARQQAEHLGGSLEYINLSNEDEGACFELKLPLAEA